MQVESTEKYSKRDLFLRHIVDDARGPTKTLDLIYLIRELVLQAQQYTPNPFEFSPDESAVLDACMMAAEYFDVHYIVSE